MTEQAHWNLIDILSHRCSHIPEGEWVAVGTHQSCDIVVEGHPVRDALLVQATCEDGFVFLSDGCSGWAHPSSWVFSGRSAQFGFESLSCPISGVTQHLKESEICDLFRNPYLQKTLESFQNRNPFSETFHRSSGDLFREVCVELGCHFWSENEVSEMPARVLFRKLVWALNAHISGLGPLTHFMMDSSVTEIMVCRYNEIFVERKGNLQKSEIEFFSQDDLRSLIERAVSRSGRRIDESSPTCDFRWHDGSRLHATIPPVSVNGPTLTIRRFPETMFTPADFVRSGTASHEMMAFLRDSVYAKRNILISGGTGSGKTTILNLMSSFISKKERIITIEDTAELRIQHEHVVRLEARPPNAEGKAEIPLRDLVRNALRMRPDRIIVGECRGPEALDMLQAMNTGHEGSLSTIHANTPIDALRRLETLVMLAGADLPLAAVREQIASALHCVVQMEKVDGKRRIAAIHNIRPLHNGTYVTETVLTRGKTLNS